MRNAHILSAMAAMSLLGSVNAGDNVIDITPDHYSPEPTRGKSSSYGTTLNLKTGRDYPHSSTRQRARYARQIAAGKLHMAGTGV